MKFRAMAIILLSLTFIVPTQLSGQASEMDELFSLCSRFPHNSKCKDYTAPIPLKNRSGEEVSFLLGNQKELEKSKVLLTEESLTFYVETGKGINVLDGAKDTKEVTFPLDAIKSFSYSEKEKTDVGAVLAFGLFGLLSKEKTSTFNIHFKQIETTEEVKTTELMPRRAVFIVKRKIGRAIREDIEQKTNLVADFLDIE